MEYPHVPEKRKVSTVSVKTCNIYNFVAFKGRPIIPKNIREKLRSLNSFKLWDSGIPNLYYTAPFRPGIFFSFLGSNK